MYTFNEYVKLLNEGLIKTHDGQTSLTYLLDILKSLKIDVSGYVKNNNIISISINRFNTIDNDDIKPLFDTIKSYMINLFGWFPTSMEIKLINGLSNKKQYDEDEIVLKKRNISELNIEFDSKFDILEKYTGKLYHLSIQEYQNKILKHGLEPKSKNKLTSHLDRIYVCKTVEDCKILIPQMILHYNDIKNYHKYELGNKKYRKNTDWIIYEINVKDINLYKDPRYMNGYYILDNINKDYINIIEKE